MRGVRPTKAIEEAQRCAEKMGYHWIKNTDPVWQFDAFMFRQAVIAAFKIKKVRHAIDENAFIERLFSEEVNALRSLPLPLHVLRELWIRTPNERAWRRFYILPERTAEIEFNTAENYRNTHFDEEKWRCAPFRIDIPLPAKKGIKSDKPVKGSFWQTDEVEIFSVKMVSTPGENTE